MQSIGAATKSRHGAQAEVSRAWNLFTEFVAKSHGFRGSAITFSDFCGYLNHN